MIQPFANEVKQTRKEDTLSFTYIQCSLEYSTQPSFYHTAAHGFIILLKSGAFQKGKAAGTERDSDCSLLRPTSPGYPCLALWERIQNLTSSLRLLSTPLGAEQQAEEQLNLPACFNSKSHPFFTSKFHFGKRAVVN